MNREHWQAAQAAYESLRGLSDAEQRTGLERLRTDDPQVHAIVAGMLTAGADDARLLPSRVVELETVVERATAFELRNDFELDRYRVVGRLGEGGMGVVYEAERADGAIDRPVALKVLKRGLDTDLFLRRFAQEREALSRLEHPNIARLLDAGSCADGRPYLVMELVRGVPIRAWCNERHASVRARVELFLQVCEAVAHAHHKLVLHRDLKPSNVMVTPDGTAKLLDFGIAKMLDADRDDTITRERLLTPRYASPELVEGRPVTTASDVYALGVVLYELLAGRGPYELEDNSARAIERAIREQTPTPPSVAATRPVPADPAVIEVGPSLRGIGGDLDVVVLQAIAKDPERRYASVDALAADLRAYLDGRPVSARPDTAWYRARMLVRRNPLQVAGAVTIVAVLTGLTAYSMIQRSRAEDAVAEAEARLVEVEAQKAIVDAVNTFYTDRVLGQANPETSGDFDMTVADALRSASEGLEDQFADAPLVEARIQAAIGYFFQMRSRYEEAEPHVLRAWQLRAEYDDPDDTLTLNARRDYGNTLFWQERYEEALAIFEEVWAAEQRTRGAIDGYSALTVSLLGQVHQKLGRREEAVSYLRMAYEHRLDIWGERHGNTMTSMNNLAVLYRQLERYDEALALLERVAVLRAEEFGRTHPRTLIARGNLAATRFLAGRRDGAIQDLEAVRRDQLAVIGPTHAHTLHVLGQLISFHAAAGNDDRMRTLRAAQVSALTERYGAEDSRTLEARKALDLVSAGS